MEEVAGLEGDAVEVVRFPGVGAGVEVDGFANSA